MQTVRAFIFNLIKHPIPQGSKDKGRRGTDYIPPADIILRALDETPDCNQKDGSYPIEDIWDGKVSLGDGLYMDITGIGDIDENGDFLD